jgi:membrane protein DedA with SNARE-associated domain
VDYVPGWVDSHGWWAVFLFLFVIVFLRAQGSHWLGRLAVAGAAHTRLRRYVDGPVMQRAHAYLEKWGPIGVPLSFLTVGFQTAVQVAAGVGRMSFALYTVVMIPGCVAWAALYTGLAASALSLTRSVTWAAVTLLAVVLVATVVAVILRRRNAGSFARTPQ